MPPFCREAQAICKPPHALGFLWRAQEATYLYGNAWHVITPALVAANIVVYCLMLTSTMYRVDGKVRCHSPLCLAAPSRDDTPMRPCDAYLPRVCSSMYLCILQVFGVGSTAKEYAPLETAAQAMEAAQHRWSADSLGRDLTAGVYSL